MAKKSPVKQGTRILCETLQLIYETSIDAVQAATNDKDAGEAGHVAEQALQDGLAWGCAWAKRAAARENRAPTQTRPSGR